MPSYLELCETEFWRQVFEQETDYLLDALKGRREILSVGCGPAIIERGLAERGFIVTGLDVSKEALNGAPDTLRTVVGNAEHMDFLNSSFDAAIYVASLQFIADYKGAIRETARVLRPNGGLVVMLLDPKSEHFKRWTQDSDSYMCRIRHTDIPELEAEISKYFSVKSEYFLGISGEKVFQSNVQGQASLYVVQGLKKHGSCLGILS